ncbi:hypothetical protein H6P81_017822 [Aristolochia fimbriata]|uniref:Uncharacterized protein n=1 Tax=Aristolochia fimbriata TaxID=158543 RepID=A0AAV7DZP1_ARIFI|nr:hypothetical protein H6P81_017822 [Aristolochia fimbriata]
MEQCNQQTKFNPTRNKQFLSKQNRKLCVCNQLPRVPASIDRVNFAKIRRLLLPVLVGTHSSSRLLRFSIRSNLTNETKIYKAANGVGVVLGNTFVAPIKNIFGRSCEGICSGTWDIICFIEHLCVSNLVKLLFVFILTYITLLFFYLLFKLGIIQCIGRSLCKMCWATCETYWHAMRHICCFCWYKIRTVKRQYRGRRRFRDIEQGSSSSSDGEDGVGSINVVTKRRSIRERRKDRIRRSLYPLRQSSRGNSFKSLRGRHTGGGRNTTGGRSTRQVRLRHAARRQQLRLVKKRKGFGR